MRQDMRLGRVAGTQVAANGTVAVILALIAWLLAGSVLPGAAPHQRQAVPRHKLDAAAAVSHEIRPGKER